MLLYGGKRRPLCLRQPFWALSCRLSEGYGARGGPPASVLRRLSTSQFGVQSPWCPLNIHDAALAAVILFHHIKSKLFFAN